MSKDVGLARASESISPVKSGWWGSLQQVDFSRYATIITLLTLVIILSILRPATFFSFGNLVNILGQSSLQVIMACGLTVCLVVGDFDLAIASIASVSAMIVVTLIVKLGIAPPVAILGVLVFGIVVGLLNGLAITKLRISAFIATLASGSILVGISYLANNGESIYTGIPRSFIDLGRDSPIGLPWPVIDAAVVAAVLWVLLTRTATGRHFYAIGGNPEAARLSGINVDRHRILAFMISAATGTITGILFAARLGQGGPVLLQSFLLPAYATAFLGAATLRRGQFHILGTVVGVILLQVAVVGMTMLNVPITVDYVFQGVMLLVALYFSGRVRRV